MMLLAGAMPLKERVPIFRDWPLSVRTRQLGRVLVRDHSEMLVIHEVLIGDVYDLDKLDSDPQLIVDLGANIGVTLLEFHRRFPSARVVGYEAVGSTFRLAQRNIAGKTNLAVNHAAVVGREGQYAVETVPGESWAAHVGLASQPQESGSNSVAGVTLDTIIQDLGSVDVLKIDVEGAEYAVLSACSRFSDIRAVVGEFHRESGVTPTQFFDLFDGFDIDVDASALQSAHGRAAFTAVRTGS